MGYCLWVLLASLTPVKKSQTVVQACMVRVMIRDDSQSLSEVVHLLHSAGPNQVEINQSDLFFYPVKAISASYMHCRKEVIAELLGKLSSRAGILSAAVDEQP